MVDPTNITATLNVPATLSLAFANMPGEGMGVDVTTCGVVHDPEGQHIDANTQAYQKALDETAGNTLLVHPAALSVVVRNLRIARSETHWRMDGALTLAGNENRNIVDIGQPGALISRITLTGRGVFYGNRTQQQGGDTQVSGGICANTLSHTGITPDSPSLPAVIENLLISGVTIRDTFNWPLSLGYIKDSLITKVSLINGGNSPQFIWSAENCWFTDSFSCGHTDGGFVFYMGCRQCGAVNNSVFNNHDGIGVYNDTSAQPENNGILIANNHIYNNADSGIGVTTMTQTGTGPAALKQKNVLITGNILSNNNTGGRNGGGSIGLVSAYGVKVTGNRIEKDGQGASSGQPVFSVYVSDTCENIQIDGNSFDDIGSPTNPGTAIYINQASGVAIRNNTFADSAADSSAADSTLAKVGAGFHAEGGTLHNGLGGSLGPRTFISGNIALTPLAGPLMALAWLEDTIFLNQPDGKGHLFSNQTHLNPLNIGGSYSFEGETRSQTVGSIVEDAGVGEAQFTMQVGRIDSTGEILGRLALSSNKLFRALQLRENSSVLLPTGDVALAAYSADSSPLLQQSFTTSAVNGEFVPFPKPFASDDVTVTVPTYTVGNGTEGGGGHESQNFIIAGPSMSVPPNRNGFVLSKATLTGSGLTPNTTRENLKVVALGRAVP